MLVSEAYRMSAHLEKRLVLRILAYWREIQGDRRFPRPDEISEAHLGADAQFCFRLAIAPGAPEPVFVSLGEFFRGQVPDVAGISVSACPSGSLLAAATGSVGDVLSRGVPVSIGGVATNGGQPVLFRSILLPLSSDGVVIDEMLGAANCRPVEGGARVGW
jgi:hypothetical protein